MVYTRKMKFIFAGMIFLFFGLTSSPTLVSGYHILIFIPTLLLFKEGLRYKLEKSSWALLFLVTWGLISTVYNNDQLHNPFKSYQELKYYCFGVFCIGTLSYFFKHASKKHIRLLLNLFLFTIVVGFFVGILRSKFGFDPIKWSYVPDKYHTRVGGFTNYMRYGYSSALMIILGVGACFNLKKIREFVSQKWLFIFLVFNSLAVIFSETRGALLVLVSGISFLLIKYKPKLGKSLVGFGVVSVLAIGIISYSKRADNRYLNINDGSNYIRMSQFYSAYRSISDNPVFGLGADQFSYNVKDIKIKYDIWAKDYSGHTHNIFLEHAANYGIPGLLCFLSFLIFWFIELIKDKSDVSWIIASYLVGFVIGGQVELLFDVINSHLLFFMYSYSKLATVKVTQAL